MVLRDVFAEAKRILKPTSIAIYFVDLSDHFQHRDRSITRINFLRYSDDEWAKIAGKQFAYCNRLRASDYFKLFSDCHFQVLRKETAIDVEALDSLHNGFVLNDKFQQYDPEDITNTCLLINLIKAFLEKSFALNWCFSCFAHFRFYRHAFCRHSKC